MINIILLVVVEVMLILGPPIYPPIKLIFSQTGIMGFFIHLRVIVQHPPWLHDSVRVVNLVFLVVLHLSLQLVMVKVVCLVPPKISSKKMIVGFMVMIL